MDQKRVIMRTTINKCTINSTHSGCECLPLWAQSRDQPSVEVVKWALELGRGMTIERLDEN